MNNEEWVNKYKPIKNPNNDWGGDYSSFETYTPDATFVSEQPNYNVWTEVDGDNGVYIVNGMAYVNRIQYYVCEVPWQEGDDICITVCEYVTCSCYNEEEQEGNPDCDVCNGDGNYTDWKD